MKIMLNLKGLALETQGEHISWLQLMCFLQHSRKKRAEVQYVLIC